MSKETPTLNEMLKLWTKKDLWERIQHHIATIDQLKQQLEETNAGYDFTYEQSRETIKELKQNQTQLAIQELEEIKRILYESHYREIDNKYYAEMEDVEYIIDQKIKELKGE